MPWREDLLSIEQPPGSVLFLCSLLFSILFTLWNSIHKMIASLSKWWHLQDASVDQPHKSVIISSKTLSRRAMKSENPNVSFKLILSARTLHNSLEVVAESANNVFVLPSIKVTGNMIGFFDFVACTTSDHLLILIFIFLPVTPTNLEVDSLLR